LAVAVAAAAHLLEVMQVLGVVLVATAQQIL
jgi:hypothetical protein